MMKQPKDFISEVKINYSDDAGNSMEKRFVFKPENSYDDFMQEADKMFAFVRATYGATEFDELQKKNEETPEEVSDKVVPLKKTVVTDKEV